MTRRKHILVINDNTRLLKQLERYLLTDGYKVTITESGKEGVRLLKKKEFNLILIDFHLDKDKNKTAEFFIPKLKAIDSSIPIILMSAIEENVCISDFNVIDFIYIDDFFWGEFSNRIKNYINIEIN